MRHSTCVSEVGILNFADEFILVATLVFHSDIRPGCALCLLLRFLHHVFFLDLRLTGAITVSI